MKMAKSKGKTIKSKVVKVDHSQDAPIQPNKSKSDRKRTRSLTTESPSSTESKQRKVLLKEQKKSNDGQGHGTRKLKVKPGTSKSACSNEFTSEQTEELVVTAVEGDEEDFMSENEEEEVENDQEDLDYDSEGLDEELGIAPGFEETDQIVDLEINFRIPAGDVNVQTNTVQPEPQAEMIRVDDLQGYVQRIVENKWREKEIELLKKHNIPVDKAAPISGNGNVLVSVSPIKNQNANRNVNSLVTKSPSDTTVYAPALQRTPEHNFPVIINTNPAAPVLETTPHPPDLSMIDKISDFVQGVRDEQEKQMRTTQGSAKKIEGRVDYARDLAAKLVIEAEKYKAEVTKPKGRLFENVSVQGDNPQVVGEGVNRHFLGVGSVNPLDDGNQILEDDDFFHVTCHVDKQLAEKIERGVFVDLEKLLLKDRFKKKDDDRLEFVNRDGHTFLAPVQDREVKINGIRKWEQAFRVYAAIFCKANPARAAEIWQYVHTINTAAASYSWDNVAYYDYTFRQMMSQNTKRSWAKIFNQLWNLAMCNPIQRGNNVVSGNTYSVNSSGTRYKSAAGSNTNVGSKKGAGKNGNGNKWPCWKFNKNQACNQATCDFEHKCSYCGSHGHSVLDCTKLHGKNEKGNKSSHRGNPGTS